jgi:pimeloyl-ACP methyl ester carboxylesterase
MERTQQSQRFTLQSPGEGFELKDYLSDIDAVIAHIGSNPKPPVLFGYSNHGFFTTHYALRYPEKISALILAEPALFNPREELLKRAELAFAGDAEGSIKAMINHVQPDVGADEHLSSIATRVVLRQISSSNAIGLELIARADNPISTEELASLKMPVLLLGGSKSHAGYTVRRASAAIPHAYVWWIPGATHGDLLGGAHSAQLARACSAFTQALGLNPVPASASAANN